MLDTEKADPASSRATVMKEKIRRWWAEAPMTYGETHGTTEYHLPDGSVETVEIGTRRFFELADQRFYSWNTPLHQPDGPFSAIFDYKRFEGKRVLEIGCGMGCMAMNWAQRGALVTAVDLNPTSVSQTKLRFKQFGLDGDIRESDGESLPFEDESFDYVYSWGVLHHTPGTREALAEVYRVLKPGGQFGLMLYHRNSFLYRYTIAWVEGFVNMESRFLSPLELASRYSDGAREDGNPHTWPVTKREVRRDLVSQFGGVDIKVLGTDVPVILNVWLPRLAEKLLPLSWQKAMARRFGWSLWITGGKSL
ncbi:MAG TPA: class I SAM-dependent methyltransferase [Beijerinckiaceae bacterium]|nr:class I SAM-dependent methyltransferase [Beijerinckiaceae bacterium]